MKTYCVKCRRDTENIDPKMVRTNNNNNNNNNNNRVSMQSEYPVCGIKSQDL